MCTTMNVGGKGQVEHGILMLNVNTGGMGKVLCCPNGAKINKLHGCICYCSTADQNIHKYGGSEPASPGS